MIGRALAVTAALTGGGVGATVALAPGAPEVVEGIPNRALVAYLDAAEGSSCGVQWFDLAAIGVVESGHGTHGGSHVQADGTITGTIGSSAGAQGPMQFMPDTWRSYVSLGVTDGDGDGVSNVNDVDDAAKASAEYLCRSGYQAADRASVVNAWGAYNGGANWRRYLESQNYVVQAGLFASAYAQSDVPPSVVVSGPVGQPVSAVTVERTPGRLGSNVWRVLVSRWTAIGRSESPEVRKTWTELDKALFGTPEP